MRRRDAVEARASDYADAAPPGFLLARTFDGHPTELAELHGRRVIASNAQDLWTGSR
ncbi:hypothetical protein ACFW6F_35295 [Streptomyces sp. NPDC058746]|uniref:hypothetical protein n=1 Tax=Streptomyces sp. NPDC058746 TaxID=3346622 RepID=UPI0036BEF84E